MQQPMKPMGKNKMNKANICIVTINDFYHEFACKYVDKPTRTQLIEAINDDFKRIVKSGEWKTYEANWFGFDSRLIKKIVSLTYASGINNVKCYGANTFGGDITVKLEFQLINKI